MSKLKPFLSVLVGIVAAVGYGLVVRLAFGSEQFSTLFGTLSVGFLFFVPLALGALTAYFSPAQYNTWVYAAFAPWISCVIFTGLAALFTWEAWICVVMALPLFFAMSTAGGLVTYYILSNQKSSQSQSTLMGILLLAPFLIAPLEQQFPAKDSVRVVHTQIEIQADPQTVWGNITRVSAIRPAEHARTFFALAGLPRPVRATLTHDGVGGVRRGQWEDGLTFIETISEWKLYETYTMQMAADTSRLRPTSLPLHEIGGRYFDVVEGKYTLEPTAEGVILHFTSKHRLSTRFNFYAGLWTDFFMRDVQNYILHIVKARSEAPVSSCSATLNLHVCQR